MDHREVFRIVMHSVCCHLTSSTRNCLRSFGYGLLFWRLFRVNINWYYFIRRLISFFFFSGLNVLYRIFVLTCHSYRMYRLHSQSKSASSPSLHKIFARNCSVGEYFLLQQMGRNLNPLIFCEVLEGLADVQQQDTAKEV